MPKDYSRGKIYKIVCNITNKIYIGSTCEPTLARRLAVHVNDFKAWLKDDKRRKITSFEIIEGGDYYIELLEVCSCNINEELLARERFYIKNNDCVNKYKNLNRTKDDDKEYKKGYIKKYYNENIDTILEKKKEYYNENIDTILEKAKQYYNKNIDKRKEYNSLKGNCPQCNKEMLKNSISRHLKKSCNI
jgi:hypothetical protein